MSGKMRVIYINIVLIAVSLIVAIFLCEVGLRIWLPMPMLSPRYDYSDDIGIIPFKNVTMIHKKPGFLPVAYTTNEMRYRGPVIPFDETKKIIVMGDSHSFGIGVNDHETYAHVLDDVLGDEVSVVNLSGPGWGLPHQVNRYLTLGEKYNPEVVVLQFCANDIGDGRREPSVTWNKSAGSFEFHKVGNDSFGRIKIFMQYVRPMTDFFSGHSQLYNHIKHPVYTFIRKIDMTAHASERVKTDNPERIEDIVRNGNGETYYIELLQAFVNHLRANGVKVIMISVGKQLDWYPEIKEVIIDMDRRGYLKYHDVYAWESKEYKQTHGKLYPYLGHRWGPVAHRWIGVKLGEYIATECFGDDFDWFEAMKKTDLSLVCNDRDHC